MVLKAKSIYFNAYNISSESNAITLDGAVEEVDNTNFGSAAKSAIAGLETVRGTVGVMLPADAALLEGPLFDARGDDASVVTFFMGGTAVGDDAISAYGLSPKFYPGGQVGSLKGTTIEIAGQGVQLLRGVVLENEVGSYDESTTALNDVTLTGGVTATQRLYLVIHVTAFAGITGLVLELESDVDDTFATPVTQITTASITGIGKVVMSVDGEITDDTFRLVPTPTGIGTYTLAATLSLVALP
jgi:hypothetical protein